MNRRRQDKVIPIKIVVKNNSVTTLNQVKLLAGTTGQTCQFFFDRNWQQLKKKITYKLGTNIVATRPIENDIITIPPEVLKTAGLPLEIGIIGFSEDNSVVIPTPWCRIGQVDHGAKVCSSSGGSSDDDDDVQHIIYDGGVIE